MLTNQKQSDGCVFVAHDPEDAHDAQALAAVLERAGLNVWVSGRDGGDPGDPGHAAALHAAASRCASFVLPVGGRPLHPQPLGDLTQMAEAAGKPIYPVRVSEQAAAPPFPALARARAWIDATGPQREENLSRFAAELRQLRPQAQAPAAAGFPPQHSASSPPAAAHSHWAASAPPAPAPSGAKKFLMIAAGIIMVLAGLAQMARGLGAFSGSTRSQPTSVAPQADMNMQMPVGSGTASTSSATGTTVYDSWLTGKWGYSGTGCTVWMQFLGSGVVTDNQGTTGTWSLNAMNQILFMTLPNGSTQTQVTRSGETLILIGNGNRQEWQRCA
ncbi:MAG TPA: TIR domain-containing protein [Allosphingosinicella sp.]